MEIQNPHGGGTPKSSGSGSLPLAGPTCPAGVSHRERRRRRSGNCGAAGVSGVAQRACCAVAALLLVWVTVAAATAAAAGAAEPRLADRFDPTDKGLAGGWQVVRGQAESQLLVASPAWVFRSINGYAYALKPAADAKPVPDALVLAGEAVWDDYAFTVALKGEPGVVAGQVVRYSDDNNWTQILLAFPKQVPNETGRLLLVQRRAGKERIMASRRLELQNSEWYRLRVALTGPHILVWLGNSLALHGRDAKPHPGRVGLYARGAAAVLFDDAQVETAGIALEDFTVAAGPLRPRCGAWERVTDAYPPTHVHTVADELLIATFRAPAPVLGEISADVMLGDGRAVGVLVESREPCGRVAGNGWALQVIEQDNGSRLALVRLTRGNAVTIQVDARPVEPVAWQNVRLSFEPRFLRAWCGERLLFEQWDETFVPVRAGVLAHGAGAGIDNVMLAPLKAPVDPWLADTMVQDLEMKHQWAHPAWSFMTTDLFPKAPNAVPLPWNKGEYFRDFDLRVPVKDWAAAKGKLLFFLDSGDRNEKNGYRLMITRQEKTGTLEAQFSFQGKALATGRRAVAGPGVDLQVIRRGRCLALRADDRPVLRYDGL